MRDKSVKWLLSGLLACIGAIALGAADAAAQSKTRVTVYTALENDQLGPYKEAFEKDNPTIEIAWVRDSTGVITARLLAEKDNPRADIIWGLGASSVALFELDGDAAWLHAAGCRRLEAVVPRLLRTR